MRAATVIVGAIAVSSCLIALALLLTKDSGNTTQARVKPPAQEEKADSQPSEATTSPASGPVQCNVEVTVEGGSCFLGKNVLAAYEETGAANLTAVDPQSGEELAFECSGTAPTICGGTNGVVVYLAP